MPKGHYDRPLKVYTPTATTKDLACLNCSLPICDDKSAECAFMAPVRIQNARAQRERYWSDPDAERQRQRERYWTDPDAERQRVERWQQENKEKVRAKQRRYYARKATKNNTL